MRWPATVAAAIYMGVNILMNWVLPLFPGEAKLAPIYNPVDHMVPASFPLLLIVPGLAIDLIVRRYGNGSSFGRDWLLALVVAAAFLALFLGTQWHFSKFMLGWAADNWIFTGNRFWPYYAQQGDWRFQFWDTRPRLAHDGLTLMKIAWAFVLAVIASRAGLGIGNWLSKVRR